MLLNFSQCIILIEIPLKWIHQNTTSDFQLWGNISFNSVNYLGSRLSHNWLLPWKMLANALTFLFFLELHISDHNNKRTKCMLLTEPLFPRKCQLLLATFLSIHQSFYFEIIFCERAQLALLFSLHSVWKCIAHPMQLFSIHFFYCYKWTVFYRNAFDGTQKAMGIQ